MLMLLFAEQREEHTTDPAPGKQLSSNVQTWQTAQDSSLSKSSHVFSHATRGGRHSQPPAEAEGPSSHWCS